MTIAEYRQNTTPAKEAQAVVSGVLRGGWLDRAAGLFYYCSHGFHSVPVVALRDLVVFRKISKKIG